MTVETTVTIVWDTRLKPGAEAEGLRLTRQVWSDMRSFEGYVSHQIFIDQEAPGHIIALAQWRSRADADAVREKYKESETIRRLTLLLARPRERWITSEDDKEKGNMTVKPVPDGYHSVTAYLSIQGAAEAIEFYKRALNATELFRLVAPNGEIGHAEIRIGDSSIMLADPCEGSPFRSPEALGGASVGLHVYVEDVDALFAQAVTAGAKVVKPVQDQFYGDRTGTLKDPFGHVWFLATHKEDLTPEEINKRAEARFKQGGA